MSTDGGTRAVLAALGANLGIAISKFVAFGFTGSSSMLSEAVHSVADSGNQLLLLGGGRGARREANARHQFGYGRVRYLSGFVVSVVLFLLGGVFALYEGIHRVSNADQVGDSRIALIVLLVAIVLETLSFRTAIREANHARGSRSFVRYVRESRAPEIPVILLEDAGALLGLIFALFGVGLSSLTGDSRWDGVGAVAVGVLLVCIAGFLAIETASLLVGESALPQEEAVIRASLEGSELIERVIHLRTMHVGPDELLVAAKIAIHESSTAREIARGIDDAERALRAKVPTAKYVFLEPDLDLLL